jgi:hypothetical protein
MINIKGYILLNLEKYKRVTSKKFIREHGGKDFTDEQILAYYDMTGGAICKDETQEIEEGKKSVKSKDKDKMHFSDLSAVKTRLSVPTGTFYDFVAKRPKCDIEAEKKAAKENKDTQKDKKETKTNAKETA